NSRPTTGPAAPPDFSRFRGAGAFRSLAQSAKRRREAAGSALKETVRDVRPTESCGAAASRAAATSGGARAGRAALAAGRARGAGGGPGGGGGGGGGGGA